MPTFVRRIAQPISSLDSKPSRGPQPIADLLRQFLKENGVRRPSGDERLLQAWAEAAGAPWKQRATPVAFRGGQLIVEVSSSLDLAELKGFAGEGIRKRANAALGEDRLRKVVFKLKS
jgi:hypothetical protein